MKINPNGKQLVVYRVTTLTNLTLTTHCVPQKGNNSFKNFIEFRNSKINTKKNNLKLKIVKKFQYFKNLKKIKNLKNLKKNSKFS